MGSEEETAWKEATSRRLYMWSEPRRSMKSRTREYRRKCLTLVAALLIHPLSVD
jgi:hypothetical protein